MKIVLSFLAGAVVAVVSAILFYHGCVEPKIVKETETVTKYIKVPQTDDEYRECYLSPIQIAYAQTGYSLHIKAGDACKEKEKTITFNRPSNLLMLQVVPMLRGGETRRSLEVGFALSYYRMFGFAGIGGGLFLTPVRNHAYDYGIVIGGVFLF